MSQSSFSFIKDFAKTGQGRQLLKDELENAINSLRKLQEQLSDASEDPRCYGDPTQVTLQKNNLRASIQSLQLSINTLSEALDNARQNTQATPKLRG